MKEKRVLNKKSKLLGILNSKPVIGALIFIMLSLVMVIAGNVIVKEGDSYFDGNVGIGTTDPNVSLHIKSASGTAFQRWTDGTKTYQVGVNTGGGTALNFQTKSGTNLLSLGDNGKVGIGIVSPALRLSVEDSQTATFVASFRNTANGVSSHGIQIRFGNDSVSGALGIEFLRNSAFQIGRIEEDTTGSVAYLTSSDIRIKQNIQNLTTNVLDKITQVNVIKYNTENSNKTMVGLSAQQMYELYPYAVSGKPTDSLYQDRTEIINGTNITFQVTVPMAIDYGRLTPFLIKAIQEQQSQIEEMRSDLCSLGILKYC